VELTEARAALALAQARIGELEAVRRKLHNAVLVSHAHFLPCPAGVSAVGPCHRHGTVIPTSQVVPRQDKVPCVTSEIHC
jgi:hypothetical protein